MTTTLHTEASTTSVVRQGGSLFPICLWFNLPVSTSTIRSSPYLMKAFAAIAAVLFVAPPAAVALNSLPLRGSTLSKSQHFSPSALPRRAVERLAAPPFFDEKYPAAPTDVAETGSVKNKDLFALSIFLALPSCALAADANVAAIGSYVLDPALNLGQFFMLLRVIMSWYPEVKINKMPYLLVAFPTEPILRATRAVIPPAFGVDISPVIWIAILSLCREILFGQQGLFKML